MARARSSKNSSADLGFEAKLWLAADRLRSNMDAGEYKHVVLGLIFLKYISDTFEDSCSCSWQLNEADPLQRQTLTMRSSPKISPSTIEDSSQPGTTYPGGLARDTEWRWPLVPARKLVSLNYGRALKADTRSLGKVPVFGTNGQCGWHDAPLAEAPGLILGRKGQGPRGIELCDKDFWVIGVGKEISA
ncbi:MAG TPA: type I restriction-modification system subunit M N-terminal domain-containing protein [Chthoniobacterales bacterium]|nr:type I restriction-modification system subunit M N-terminal domain-containing protein [Chthoniobacterales bacterium]